MNGAEQQIFDAVKENGKNIGKLFTQLGKIETTQILQHGQNVKDIDEIKKEVKKYTGHSMQMYIQWGLFVIVIGWLIKLSLS